jgi:hypothetical protein
MMTDWREIIGENLSRIHKRVARAAERSGRSTGEITLVAVAKTFPAEAIRAAWELGVRHFGENRVQEWEDKKPQLTDLNATWHLVGHLQSNKARRAIELFHTIDTVDSLELAERLNRLLGTAGESGPETPTKAVRNPMPVLVEVLLEPEEGKSGIDPNALPLLVQQILRLPNLRLLGLMCIPPFTEDPEQTRPHFRRLRELRNSLRTSISARAQLPAAEFLPQLSMGMSNDFEVAVEEGATQIRLGTALFGQRE